MRVTTFSRIVLSQAKYEQGEKLKLIFLEVFWTHIDPNDREMDSVQSILFNFSTNIAVLCQYNTRNGLF